GAARPEAATRSTSATDHLPIRTRQPSAPERSDGVASGAVEGRAAAREAIAARTSRLVLRSRNSTTPSVTTAVVQPIPASPGAVAAYHVASPGRGAPETGSATAATAAAT